MLHSSSICFTHHQGNFLSEIMFQNFLASKSCIYLWSPRDLTPICKIVLIKSFFISKLVYLFSVLQNLRTQFFKDVEILLYKFYLAQKAQQSKTKCFSSAKCKGGLNMIDVRSFATSLKCEWVKLYFDENEGLWKVLFDEGLKRYGKGFLF